MDRGKGRRTREAEEEGAGGKGKGKQSKHDEAGGQPSQGKTRQGERDGPRILRPPAPAARTGGGGGAGGGHDLDGPRVVPEHILGLTLVMGKFKTRTRTSTARQEALQTLKLIGSPSVVVRVFGAGTTSSVGKMQRSSWEADTRAIQTLRDLHTISNYADGDGRLWGSRGLTPAEVARTAPAARAVRRIKEVQEPWAKAGAPAAFEVEAEYKLGDEAVYLSYDDWRSEEMPFYRDQERGLCQVDEVRSFLADLL